MSVLNFPRLYMNGHFFWNPPTANNNDVLPLYDAVKMDLNWPFLAQYGVYPENARKKLLPWIISALPYDQIPDYVLQVPGNGSPSGYPMMPAEWDLFGDNACGTVDYNDIRSLIIGGELQANSYIEQDPVVGKGYQLLGNPFGSDKPTPARFVDISPWQNTFTAMYFDRLVLGDATCGLTATRAYRMLDRFLNFNWGAVQGLNTVTTAWQTCFPRENLQWQLGDSALLQALRQQMEAQNAQGLMFRFTTYLTYYDRNGIFNDYRQVNTRCNSLKALEALQGLYQAGLDNVADIVINPAYSRTAGVLGLWFADEYPTAPAGRRLEPATKVPILEPIPGNPGAPPTITLGVISAQAQGDLLSLDLGTGFPFYPVPNSQNTVPQCEKLKLGSFQVGIQQNGEFQPLADLTFDQYAQAAFDKRAGLVDLPVTDAVTRTEAGTLALQTQGSKPKLAAQQQMWTAEVIESGTFIDVGDTRTLQIMVQYDGLPAPAGTTLWVAEYNNPFMLTTSNYYLAFNNDIDFTLIKDHPTQRKDNKPGMPQFLGGQAQASLLTEGSGRSLRAINEAPPPDEDDDEDPAPPEEPDYDFVPIRYQDYLKTPAGLSLAPCLQFIPSIPCTGVLDNGATVNYSLTQITTDANGIAQVTVQAIAAGFPTLRFFVQDGPGAAPAVPFSFKYTEAYTDFLAPLRVLPDEPGLMGEFVAAWNQVCTLTDARAQIWEGFIYPRIFEPFYYLYPIMDKYMPLNSLQRIEGAIDQLIRLVSKPYQEESTLAMPITRDLPQSRRAVLERWANELVKLNYPPRPLT
ncbi:hypothetical protein R0G64_06160 [Pseudomonas otitidis]|uniref:Uncharacterized protein n=1 Tax=Metapseudomonas otitidis TaxID=319939 RepID=A0ABU3XM65_9GAMM|nr:hypothetical protein [Pseudomonas otitidis]MDV3439016.1 hypothetical protein [Pseudomonas otitidis]WMR31217.1 hypothetical protein QT513_18725 [Pseudomonas otitidis]